MFQFVEYPALYIVEHPWHMCSNREMATRTFCHSIVMIGFLNDFLKLEAHYQHWTFIFWILYIVCVLFFLSYLPMQNKVYPCGKTMQRISILHVTCRYLIYVLCHN
jgi:hypothetical protein